MYKITFFGLLLIGIFILGCGKETPAPVPKVVPEQVVMDVGDSTMAIGSFNTLEAWVLPENADDKTLLWSSTDPSVVSVDANGRIEGLKEGTAYIAATAKLGGARTTRQVTVQRDVDRVRGWFEYITVPNRSFTAIEVYLSNESNTPLTVKAADVFYSSDTYPSNPPGVINKVIPGQAMDHVFTYDSYVGADLYYMKVYFTINNKSYAMTVRNGSWRTDLLNDFSIGIDPEWSDDDTTVELPTP